MNYSWKLPSLLGYILWKCGFKQWAGNEEIKKFPYILCVPHKPFKTNRPTTYETGVSPAATLSHCGQAMSVRMWKVQLYQTFLNYMRRSCIQFITNEQVKLILFIWEGVDFTLGIRCVPLITGPEQVQVVWSTHVIIVIIQYSYYYWPTEPQLDILNVHGWIINKLLCTFCRRIYNICSILLDNKYVGP